MGILTSVLLTQRNIIEEHTAQQHPLGCRGYTRDGRSFRYAKAGAAITKGRLCTAAAVNASFSDDQQFTTAFTTGETKVGVYWATSANASEGYYDEGYMFINDDHASTDREGMILQIKHIGGSTKSISKSTVTFMDNAGLSTKVSTYSQCGFVKNMYDSIVMAPVSIAAPPVGIALRNIASGKYFWIQTWGVAPIKCAGTVRAGHVLIQDLGTNTGFVKALVTETAAASEIDLSHMQPVVGNCIEVGATTETGLIDLHIAP